MNHRHRHVVGALVGALLITLIGALMADSANAQTTLSIPAQPTMPGQVLQAINTTPAPDLVAPANVPWPFAAGQTDFQIFPAFTGTLYAILCQRTGTMNPTVTSFQTGTQKNPPWQMVAGQSFSVTLTQRKTSNGPTGTARVCFSRTLGGPVIAFTDTSRSL